MIQYPMTFTTESNSPSGIQSRWQVLVSGLEAQAAVPTEFEGPGGGYSPEDFYVLALTNCFVATFKVFAEKSKLSFKSLKASGRLTVDRDAGGVPWMKSFHLAVHLDGCAEAEKADRLMKKVSQSCMILNSVKTEKSFEFAVSA
jgi:organic hydroperoxide reductase OsmC/OhrA